MAIRKSAQRTVGSRMHENMAPAVKIIYWESVIETSQLKSSKQPPPECPIAAGIIPHYVLHHS